MPNTVPNTVPKTGHFILHSNVLPSITAGAYELRTEQTGLPFAVEPELTFVNVAAPRYTMPTDQILSTFPPANAEGAFGDRLPQVVLKRRTLPWERNPAGLVAPSPKPWLALVVVAEGEASLSTAAPVADCVTPGTVLLAPADKDVEQGLYLSVTETVVRKIFPCEEDLELLVHVREVDVNDTELAGGDDDGWLAVVLANRLPVFDRAAGKPVRYMACLINLEGQLAALPKPTPAVEVFQFELAQDWRGASAAAQTAGADKFAMGGFAGFGDAAAGAVSNAGATASTAASSATLDGSKTLSKRPVTEQWQRAAQSVKQAARDPDAQFMVRDLMASGFRLPIGLLALEKVLRFPVLAHWSFTTAGDDNFERLMQKLDVGLLGTLPLPPKAQPGKPQPPPVPDNLPEVVATGHVGLAHRSRRGDALRAWYRSPAVPFPTPRDGVNSAKPLALAHAADQLRRVIPDGREDLALAAAFEIGRLLALSQLSVVSALLRFRGEQFGAGRVRELLQSLMPFKLPKSTANAGLGRVDLGRFVAVQMVDALARNSSRMLGPQRALADSGRPLRLTGDLDQLVADGLGIDLPALKKRGAGIGVLAALQQSAVPVLGDIGATRLDDKGVAALRGALRTELQRTLAVAAPVLGVKRGAASDTTRGAARAASQSLDALGGIDAIDALDELIARAAASSDLEP